MKNIEQIKIEGCIPPKRPDFEAIYDAFIARCVEIAGEGNEDGNITDSLKAIFDDERDVYRDEYDLAKDFERNGWDVNKDFLETIGHLS